MEGTEFERAQIVSNKPQISALDRRKYVWALVFMVPQLIVFVVLSLYPIVMSYVYSFFKWPGIGPLKHFVWFSNYGEILTDSRFWGDFLHTVEYVIGTTVLSVGFALILAIILNDGRMRGKTLYRTLYFLPVVTTTAIVGIIMSNIFGVDGFVNTLLETIHVTTSPLPWLLNPTLAMLVLVLVGSWKSVGINMVYWLAGLQGISSDVYESAQLDGAGFWTTLRYITLPLLRPMLSVIVLLSIVGGMQVFDLVKTLTNGGPYFGTETLDLYIYNYAFSNSYSNAGPMMGYASAAGVLLGLFTFIVSLAFAGVGYSSTLSKRKKGASLSPGGGRNDNE